MDIDVFNTIEPALSCALEQLQESSAREPLESIQAAGAALESCRAFLEVLREPKREPFDPAAPVRALAHALQDETHLFEIEPVSPCNGDREQVAILLKTIARNVALEAESALVVELYEKDDTPRMDLSLDGPGRFAERVSFGADVTIAMENVGGLWTAATGGGRIDRTANGLSLRLRGVRMPPEAVGNILPLLQSVRQAGQYIRASMAQLRDACQTSDSDRRAATEAVESALAHGEGPRRDPEPANLGAVLAEAVSRHQEGLAARAITLEAFCDANVPPIVVRHRSISRFWDSALDYAAAALPRGGDVSILVDYEARKRAVGIVITVAGTQCRPVDTCLVASMRRAIVNSHDGAFDLSVEHGTGDSGTSSGIMIEATLPDVVGRVLDEWVPGWDAFSEKSRLMLRLLKSGGQAPPEDLILGGILEEELERLLLPRLSEAPTINLAHDLRPDNRTLPGSSPERLSKAIEQVKRGRPRKEIVRPQYAAEILWAFRKDERHRRAVGCAGLDEQAMASLCAALLHAPPDPVACLRPIAAAINKAGGPGSHAERR